MVRKEEFQVGATVLVAIAILVWGITWLKEYSLARNTRLYRVTFSQAGGLAESDEVQVNGIRKGEVADMRLEGDHVIVELKLSKEVLLTRDSKVAIRNVGMMGEKIIAVDLKTTGRPYAAGETVTGIYEMGIGEVMGQLGSTVDAISSLSIQLQMVADVLAKDGKLTNTIQNFSHTSEELRLAVAENRATLRETMSNFASAAKTAKALTTDRSSQLERSLDHFASAAEKLDRLSGRLDSLRSVIQTMSSRVERGEGTLGKLVSDEKLYTELNASVQLLKALLEDIKAHPKKYLKISVF